jgi:predicted nucleotide-binding protein
MMKKEEATRLLEDHGLKLKEQKRLPNDTGYQLIFETGEIVNVFDKGSFYAQGKNSTQTKQILSGAKETPQAAKVELPRKVFVVYGHDTTARTQLEAMLLRWNIEPLILDQLPSEGQTIIEKLENYTQQAHYAIILTTPDDEGHPANKPDEKQYRARQNVVLELGMLLSKLGRSKVAILIKGQKNMEKPSDISGLMYIPFIDNVEDGKTQLYKELCSAGFQIDPQKL